MKRGTSVLLVLLAIGLVASASAKFIEDNFHSEARGVISERLKELKGNNEEIESTTAAVPSEE